LIGVIQVTCGVSLGYKNFKGLQGWEIDATTLEKLQLQMKQFPRQVQFK